MDALERSPASVSLAILGSGSEAEVLKKRHGASARLHCTGKFVGRKEVALAFAAADASVAASTMETIGLTAMESLHTGTPCLFANAGGFAEHLTHDLDLSKMLIETLHGTMNVSKHFFLALYAVFLSLDLSKGLLGVLRKHGVDFFLKKKSSDNKTESCSIGNGVHWAKLYDQGFWADVAAVLREGG